MNFSNKLNKYSFLQTAASIAEKNQYRLYLVGGFVRDMILGRTLDEMDFLVVGDGTDFASQFSAALGIKKNFIV